MRTAPPRGPENGISVDLPERVRLRDGTEAMIWPLLPTDRSGLREHFELLSLESRYHRFMTPVPRLTETMLDHLVDDVDQVDHVALVLFVLPEDEAEAPGGIARIIRYPDQPADADVAVTVVDRWQGRGVATALLGALMRHRPAGVTRIVTEVCTDNAASLAMLRRLGRLTVTDRSKGCLDVVVDLSEPPAAHSESDIGGAAGPPAAPEPSSRAPRQTLFQRSAGRSVDLKDSPDEKNPSDPTDRGAR
ncbi:MAG TPA: GNAT family N-acetyltransferase [Marmoricola sp.]|nr:GNAT family N-acetyltransferase [Marmoricola sp.]